MALPTCKAPSVASSTMRACERWPTVGTGRRQQDRNLQVEEPLVQRSD